MDSVFNLMAFTGHIISHSPQSMHLSLSTITSSFSSLRASVGHFLTQTPQAMHASTSVTIFPFLGPIPLPLLGIFCRFQPGSIPLQVLWRRTDMFQHIFHSKHSSRLCVQVMGISSSMDSTGHSSIHSPHPIQLSSITFISRFGVVAPIISCISSISRSELIMALISSFINSVTSILNCFSACLMFCVRCNCLENTVDPDCVA